LVWLQVAETLPAEVLAKMHAPAKPEDIPVAVPGSIDEADGFVFGFPTR
jgi:NAD(P)H dehydrogenase (quinone)